ncbi:MAG: hypothetical protein JO051_17375 [Acidobacteriaceae bacterium]|nr:hypothetical protein [Acidobacteriaceae bacterium]
MTEPTGSIALDENVGVRQAFIIRYLDTNCRIRETRCEAPDAGTALAIFRQTFRGHLHTQIRKADVPETSTNLHRLQRGIEEH